MGETVEYRCGMCCHHWMADAPVKCPSCRSSEIEPVSIASIACLEYDAMIAAKRANPPKHQYSKWRHGGWYVHTVRYPSGAIGCVSNNYPDKKWRIACDERRIELGGSLDYTYPTREAAANAEAELVARLHVAASPVAA